MSKSKSTSNNNNLIIYVILGIVTISMFLFLEVFKKFEIGDLYGWAVWGGEPIIDSVFGYMPYSISSILCLFGIISFFVGCVKAKNHPQSLWIWTFISIGMIYLYLIIMEGFSYERSFDDGDIHQYIIRLSYGSIGFILFGIASLIWLITSILLGRKHK